MANTFSEEEKLTHPEFMLSKQLLAIKGPVTLTQARGFFHHSLGVNQLFVGEGINYSGFDEYIC